MVDPNQVSQRFQDGLCPCRGCSVARKKVFNDINNIINSSEDIEYIKYKVNEYKDSGYGIH